MVAQYLFTLDANDNFANDNFYEGVAFFVRLWYNKIEYIF